MSLKEKLIRIGDTLVEVMAGLAIILAAIFMILSIVVFVAAVRFLVGFLVGMVLVYFGAPPIILETSTEVLFGTMFVIIGFLKSKR